MKAVMLSIRPKWCELIANGKKTVEVRKSRPKLETPFKCYIYCTLPKYPHEDYIIRYNDESCFYGGGKVIGEFICDKIDSFDSDFDEWANSCAPAGSSIESMGWNKFLDVIHGDACISNEELNRYFPENINAYLWHISDLKIYDEPKELCFFNRSYTDTESMIYTLPMQRPPQSWGYVQREVLHEIQNKA